MAKLHHIELKNILMAYIVQNYASWLPENLISSIKSENEATMNTHVEKYLVFHHHVRQN
jgi:hypothetical protein